MTHPLAARVLSGDRRAIARALSVVEVGGSPSDDLLQALAAHAGGAHVIGVTGAPGTGKSTLVGRISQELRKRDHTVAVVAVDPSSPLTGGALLGDRLRLSHLSLDHDVFFRSVASRGAGGGMAAAVGAMVTVLDAAGVARILVETVGAGQGELAVAAEAHTTVVVTAPGMGDGVQALKSGILEIADVLVVNKADREGADQAAADLSFGVGVPAASREDSWTPKVLLTIATSGEGVEALVGALDEHRSWLQVHGVFSGRAHALVENLIIREASGQLIRRLEREWRRSSRFADLVHLVRQRKLSPEAAARKLLEEGQLSEF
ncbi:MAG TPA: methylmalonyl Co-A mutase-associated GTPase MeaB [Chloroflexota bacterium]|nr:methylmalonyl Co-A mutase-associated GTPase MeaB [Chloroflexota bacterium]